MNTKGEGFKWFIDGESRTYDQAISEINDNMKCTMDGLNVHYTSPKTGVKVKTSTEDLRMLRDTCLMQDRLNNLDTIVNVFTSDSEEELRNVLMGRKPSEAKVGKKESQTVKKAPIFTYCKVNKHAIEALSLRTLQGHEKYEVGDDWENFARLENGDFEYSNAAFRHALEIGEDTEEEHLVAQAWNSVARLEVYYRNKK